MGGAPVTADCFLIGCGLSACRPNMSLRLILKRGPGDRLTCLSSSPHNVFPCGFPFRQRESFRPSVSPLSVQETLKHHDSFILFTLDLPSLLLHPLVGEDALD